MTTQLDTRSKDAIVSSIAAGMQGRLSTFLNFAIGSVFRALAEAYAGVSLWLQKQFVVILALTRAATSDGDDLDSWMADWGLVRLGARSATGQVTFARYTASGSSPTVPVGTLVQTGDGSQRFAVVADPTVSTYSAAANGYVMLAGDDAIDVPIQAVTAGTTANVAAGAISLLASSLPGIDTVTNAAGLTNGMDAESDGDFRARFVLFIAGLSKATRTALASAIAGVQQGLRMNFREFTRADGTSDPTMNTIYVDDGSGAPPSAVVAQAAQVVNDTRAFGVRVGVIAASTASASISMTVTVAAGYYAPDVSAAVAAALSTYINGLSMGQPLRFSRLAQIAYDASAGVTNVSSVLLNSGTSDLTPTPGQTVKVTALIVNTAS